MLKKLLVPVVMSGAVVGALALGATAYAATPAPTPATATTPAHAGKGTARCVAADASQGVAGGRRDHQRQDHRHHPAGTGR